MEELVMASSQADARAAEMLVAHHAELDAALAVKVELVTTGARSGLHEAAAQARASLLDWCHELLVPHVQAAEATLCRAAAGLEPARLLVEAMVVEHRTIRDLVDQVGESHGALDAALLASSLRQLFAVHLTKVNDQLLPLLAGDPDTSVVTLVEDLRREASAIAEATATPMDDGYGHPLHEAGACACHERDVSGHPELDARPVPHAIRHATVFGALDAVRQGRSLVLVAPHDPIPLLRQLEGREPGAFAVDYLQRGPEAWRLLLTRREATEV